MSDRTRRPEEVSMPKPRVFVTRVIPAAGLDKVRAACDAEVWTEQMPPPAGVLEAKLATCDGVLSLLTDRFDAAVMDGLPRLRVISNYAVGFNNIDVKAATERGIAVGNTPGVLTDATADMAFCLLIAAARRVVEGHNYSTSGQWKTWEPLGHIGQDLVGRTLGVVGMGRIGYGLARRCHAGWGMTVLYHDVYRSEQAETELGARQVELDTLLRESDFVSVHTDLNDTTRGMFDAAAFRKMKKTAVFVNTARGPVMNQKDLVAALRDGVIFAAGLDVTDPEPPAPDDPLMTTPNLVIAPHIASATVASRNGMAEIAADNLILGLEGKPLRCWVNPDAAARLRQPAQSTGSA
jgi:glyoxylate reductase